VAAAGSEIHPTMEKVALRLAKPITGTLRVQMSGAVEDITDLKVDLARSSKKKLSTRKKMNPSLVDSQKRNRG
jgi:hypothetical protein